MDRVWMRKQLEDFIDLVARYERARRPGDYLGDQALYDQLHRAEPTVKRILHTLDPEIAAKVDIDQLAGPAMARNEVHRGLGVLDALDEWDRRLAPDAPVLPADQFHPWVWSAAETFWESQHFRAAVHAAASAINAHTQAKLRRRDVSDDKLMQEAFSDRPPEAGRPRLRVRGDPADPTVQSRQRGGLQLGLVCFFAIRNPAAHEVGEWPEQVALEYLATLSVLARLIDECTITITTRP
jgi:hypothetical protein